MPESSTLSTTIGAATDAQGNNGDQQQSLDEHETVSAAKSLSEETVIGDGNVETTTEAQSDVDSSTNPAVSTSLEASSPNDNDNAGGSPDAGEKSTKRKGGVAFSTVRVHTHRLTLGDHPGVSAGVPLELAWNVEDSETFDVDEFEDIYSGGSSNLKGTGKISAHRLPRAIRDQIAHENHSRSSLIRRQKEVLGIQKSRRFAVQDRAALMTSIRQTRRANRIQHRTTNSTTTATTTTTTTKKKDSGFNIFRWFKGISSHHNEPR